MINKILHLRNPISLIDVVGLKKALGDLFRQRTANAEEEGTRRLCVGAKF